MAKIKNDLTPKQKVTLDGFISGTANKFKKFFRLDEKRSDLSSDGYSLVVLQNTETSELAFTIVKIKKTVEVYCGLICLPPDLVNISLDRKMSLVFVTQKDKMYSLVNFSGKVVHQTESLELPETLKWMEFSEEVTFMCEFGIC